MQKLDSAAEKSHLAAGQQVEEKARSIDYDVWECPSGHHLSLAYANPDSEDKICPACHHRTLAPSRLRVQQAATTAAEGWGWRVAQCRFCKHEEKTREVIPRRPTRAERAASSSSSSSWGSSSGSSSSSSSSTSSGGSSGGGGAGSSW